MLQAPANIQLRVLRRLYVYIYSQLPYNISNSRFEIKLWVLIDTNSFMVYVSVAQLDGLQFQGPQFIPCDYTSNF